MLCVNLTTTAPQKRSPCPASTPQYISNIQFMRMPRLPYIRSSFPSEIMWVREFSFILPFFLLKTPRVTFSDCMAMPSLGPGLDSLQRWCTLTSSGEFDLKNRTHGANRFSREDLSGTRKWTRDWWPEPPYREYFHCLTIEGMSEGDYLLSRELCRTWPSAFHSCWKFNPLRILMMINFSEGYMLYSTGNHGNHHLYTFIFNFHSFHCCPHLPPHLLGVCSPRAPCHN